MKKKILVFPCGSEVALEIYRSVRYSSHFELIGASSTNDHGCFIFEKYIGGLPYIDDEKFIYILKNIVKDNDIDAIYPAMDYVAKILKENETDLGCKVIGSSQESNTVTASKIKTYELLNKVIRCPEWTLDIDSIRCFPVFIKPEIGYGSRNTCRADNHQEVSNFIAGKDVKFIYCEYLPGDEYTIDCFSNMNGEVLYVGARKRSRVVNGISVNTFQVDSKLNSIEEIAKKINLVLNPRGAWFFQLKKNIDGELTLLEVATRLGGSSSLFRMKGVNFALMTLHDAFGDNVEVIENKYSLELDRALGSKYKIELKYDYIYVDLDDCLIIDDKINTSLICFIYKAISHNKKVALITRHENNLNETLRKYRIENLFDEIIHIKDKTKKSAYINKNLLSIFIDDSFCERKDIAENTNIPVFSPDMIEAFL